MTGQVPHLMVMMMGVAVCLTLSVVCAVVVHVQDTRAINSNTCSIINNSNTHITTTVI